MKKIIIKLDGDGMHQLYEILQLILTTKVYDIEDVMICLILQRLVKKNLYKFNFPNVHNSLHLQPDEGVALYLATKELESTFIAMIRDKIYKQQILNIHTQIMLQN